jgi:aspartate kinase
VVATNRPGHADLSFTVHRDDYAEAQRAVRTAADTFPGSSVGGSDRVAKLSIVGVGMRSHTGVATKLFETLASGDVPVFLVSTSEIKVSVLIPEEALEASVKRLHAAFGLERQGPKASIL